MCVTSLGRSLTRLPAYVVLLALLIISAHQLVRAADVPTTPKPIDLLVIVLDRDEPSEFIPVRQATVARYIANGINVTTVSQSDIDKWIVDNHPDLEKRDEDLKYFRYAQSRRADAIGGIRPYDQNVPDGAQGDPAGWPWIINLRRCSRSFAMRLEYVRPSSGPVELLDEFDAMRPALGEQPTESPVALGATSLQPRKELQPRQPFTIYRDYFPDEPLPEARYRPPSDPRQPFIGVRIDPSGGMAESNRPSVLLALPGTPAESAGLKAGDIFLSVNGTATPSRDSLLESLKKCPLDQPIALELEREGQTVTFQVRPITLGEHSDALNRREAELLQSIGDKLVAPQTFKGPDGKLASIPNFNKRLVVVRMIKPIGTRKRPPAWDDFPLPRDGVAAYFDRIVPMIEMVERSNPKQVTWAVINWGEDNADIREAATEALPGARYFVWPNPPDELNDPDNTLTLSPWNLIVYRDGKFVRRIDPARLPLLLKRM